MNLGRCLSVKLLLLAPEGSTEVLAPLLPLVLQTSPLHIAGSLGEVRGNSWKRINGSEITLLLENLPILVLGHALKEL